MIGFIDYPFYQISTESDNSVPIPTCLTAYSYTKIPLKGRGEILCNQKITEYVLDFEKGKFDEVTLYGFVTKSIVPLFNPPPPI